MIYIFRVYVVACMCERLTAARPPPLSLSRGRRTRPKNYESSPRILMIKLKTNVAAAETFYAGNEKLVLMFYSLRGSG